MTRGRILRWLKANVDSTDVWFTLHGLAAFAVAAYWKDETVRAIRGEEAREDWRADVLPGVFVAFWALTSGGRARETAALRGAAVEMRGLVHDAAAQAEQRDRRAAKRDRRTAKRDRRAAQRDRRAAEQQARMLLLNKGMVVLAALTLAAAIVTLAVTIAK